MRISKSFPRHRRRNTNIRIQAGATYKQLLKDQNLLKCELCGFFDPLILPFFLIEAHHIKQVQHGGSHGLHNFVALCPNHHALADIISQRNPDLSMTKQAFLALMSEHEYKRSTYPN